ncbi:MAG: amidohydrolase family protein, partial [Phycisphaerales bacterium]|nr:amidohydrolase family protein [Phycisphaerales bacterium]
KRPFEPAAAYAAAAAHRERLVKNAMTLEKAGVRWCISTDGLGRPVDAFDTWREWVEAGLTVDSLIAALTTRPAELLGAAGELGSIEKGRRANLVVLSGPIEAKNAAVKYTIVDGRVFEPGEMSGGGGGRRGRGGPGGAGAGRRGAAPPAEPAPDAPRDDQAAVEPASAPATASAPASRETPTDPSIDALAHAPNWPIETNVDRDPGFRTGGAVLLKNATVLTISGKDLAGTCVLVTNGKITGIGRDLKAGAGVREIDLTGYVVMPGIFDPHSHIALDSVNEMSLSVVPEVRCADVVRSNDTDIYYALAGGVTGIHAMHGSANTIGGQCVLLKLKGGRPAAEMIIHDGPRTVKFATGENVTRSGRTGSARGPRGGEERARRFPGSRMGVEAVMRRSLLAGQEYAQQRAAMTKQNVPGTDPQPLRRDVRLEALADIVEGKIWVNCHCYRADEILRLLEVAEDFGIRIGALHHCLEAYRIMPEIARHGAGTATFSDWWAYKIEAFDAVPQNAGMLLRAGVNSTLKSDSSDLMRRMPLEAAKAMKVSALTSREALAMITLNAAKEFGLDKRLGSIEVGKDADIAVFDGHPLDTLSRCVLTFVEGEVYFRDREFNVDAPSKPKQTPIEFRNDAVAKAGKSLGDGSRSLNRLGSSAALPDNATAIVIENATIHPVNGPVIERGSIMVKDGRIAAVGAKVTPPAGSMTLNGEGMHVWPGMINAAATVGLSEVGSIPETIDTGETGMYVPDVAALSALNPHSATVGVTRAAGITTLLLTPSGSRIAGQASLVQLKGWTASEMDLNANLALVLNLPQRGVDPILDTKPPSDREQAFEEMRSRERADERAIRDMKSLEDFLHEAQRYAARREAKLIADAEIDARFEAMRPYVTGARPVLIAADSYKSILEVVVFADRFKIRPVILGGRDAWKAADLLAARKIPVIYDATFDLPRVVPSVPEAGEAWDANFRAAAVMEKAGVKFCFSSRDASLAKNLAHAAGFSIAHGLSEEAAVRALTLAPAEILGIGETAGSLEVGKRADLVVTDGHIARATTQVEFVMIGGEFVPTESKHTQDAERFSQRGDADLPPARADLKGSPSQSRTKAEKTARGE